MNEAERLRDKLIEHAPAPMVDEALAAERQATVERIRERLYITDKTPDFFDREVGSIRAILDEEAAQ